MFSGLIAAVLPKVKDLWGLNLDAREAALLIPDLVAFALAPTTRYSYKLHYSKFFPWCQANRREAMPPSVETVTIYFAFLSLR